MIDFSPDSTRPNIAGLPTILLNSSDQDYRFISKANTAFKPLNTMIEQYNKAISDEDKLAKLNAIYQEQKKIDSQFSLYEINESPTYVKEIHINLFSSLKKEFSKLNASVPIAISKKNQRMIHSVDTFAKILANMEPEKISDLLQILSKGNEFKENELQQLYKTADPTYREYKQFFKDHNVIYLGGVNAKNFKITSLLDASVSVIKVGSPLDNPLYPSLMLAQEGLSSGELAHVFVQRPASYYDSQGELKTQTISITEFCDEGNFVDHAKTCGFMKMSQAPTKENLRKSPRSTYISTNNGLYYYNKREDSLEQIRLGEIDEPKIRKFYDQYYDYFDAENYEQFKIKAELEATAIFDKTNKIERLSEYQLNIIKLSTGHTNSPGKGNVASSLGLITQMGNILEKARQAGVGFPDQKGTNWMVSGDCDLHIMSSSKDAAQLKALNCYCWDGLELTYIPAHGIRQTVKIDNQELFILSLKQMQGDKETSILHLSSLEISDLITSNGGHIPDGTIKIADTKSFVPIEADGNLDESSLSDQGYGLARSYGMMPPELYAKEPFSNDKMNVHMLGKNLDQYLTVCDDSYLLTQDMAQANGEDAPYDFSNPLFSTELGIRLRLLIESMVKPNAPDRISVAEALSEIKFIAMISTKPAQTLMAEACRESDLDTISFLLKKGVIPTQQLLTKAETDKKSAVIDLLKPKIESIQAVFKDMDKLVNDIQVMTVNRKIATKLPEALIESIIRMKTSPDLNSLTKELDSSITHLDKLANNSEVNKHHNEIAAAATYVYNCIEFIPQKITKILSSDLDKRVHQDFDKAMNRTNTAKKVASFKEQLIEMKKAAVAIVKDEKTEDKTPKFK